MIGHPSAHITSNEISKCSPMSSSRTARLYVLLALDLVFFFLEISIGIVSLSPNVAPIDGSTHRLCCWFSRPRRGQLSHAQVCQVPFILAIYKFTPFCSDVVSLIIALYAIKVSYLSQFALLRPANLEIAHCKLDSNYPILLRLA